MGYLLNLLYLAAILVASPYLIYAAIRHGKYREGWRAEAAGQACRTAPARINASGCMPSAWARSICWRRFSPAGSSCIPTGNASSPPPRWPATPWLASATPAARSSTARSTSPGACAGAIRRIRPDLLVLAELELWPNLVAAAKRAGAKVAIINGRLSDKSLRGYQRIGFAGAAGRWSKSTWLPSRTKNMPSGSGSSAHCHRRHRNRLDQVRRRSYRPAESRDTTSRRRLAGMRGDRPGLPGRQHAGAGRSRSAVAVFAKLVASIRTPTHPRPSASRSGLRKSPACWTRAESPGSAARLLESEGRSLSARILLVDAIGELGAWWGTAAIAFVGGSLGKRGGQNMIEPAAYGAAVSFGPEHLELPRRRRDAARPRRGGRRPGRQRNWKPSSAAVWRIPSSRKSSARMPAPLVLEQLGAADRTVELLAARWCHPSRIPPGRLKLRDRFVAVDGGHPAEILGIDVLPQEADFAGAEEHVDAAVMIAAHVHADLQALLALLQVAGLRPEHAVAVASTHIDCLPRSSVICLRLTVVAPGKAVCLPTNTR